MNDTLSVALVNQSRNTWDILFPILSAFVGGGIVTLLVDTIRNAFRKRRVRRLIAYEVKINLELLDSEYVKHNPWDRLKVWMTFYNSNSIEAISFKNSETAESIIKFYGGLELLREIDEGNIEVSHLDVHNLTAEKIEARERLGASKARLRSELIKLAKKILSDPQSTNKPPTDNLNQHLDNSKD